MPQRLAWVLPCAFMIALPAQAQEEPDIRIEGVAPSGDETHFFEEFEVPEGIVEIEVRHENLSSMNILDWGLDDPNGFRGWGGGNSEPAIVGEQAASRSYVPGPIASGTWEVVIGKPLIAETPARYEIEIFLRTEATLPPQPRTPYEDPGVLNGEARWYAGDLHVHSRQSGDADPTIGATMAVAQEVGLDFIVLSEHNTNSGLTLYGDVQDDYPDLLLVPGVEWTTYSGHANAFGATEWVDHKVGVRGVTTAGAVQAYHDQGALFSINHPTVPGFPICLGCPWELDVDPSTVDGVEVRDAVWNAVEYWEDLITGGSRAVALGGSDDHLAGEGSGVTYAPIGSPTTMVYAENLSVAAILDGIRAGRTVVKFNGVDDPMIETELSGERVGDTVFADTATLSATVTDGEGRFLAVVKNGTPIDTVAITGDPFVYEVEVVAPEEGEDRYRHQVISDSGPNPLVATVTSYVWLRAEEPELPDGGTPDGGTNPSSSSGCDCRVASPADADLVSLLALAGILGRFFRRRAT